MSTGKNSRDYIVVVDQEKIEPDLAKETIINYDPLNRSGKDGGFYLTDEGELHIDEEDVMEAHKMAVNKYPDPDAIKMVKLTHDEGEKVHQFGENGFRLYGLPVPEKERAVGIIGRNGIGKSVSMKILGGRLEPNLGDFENPPEWNRILEEFRGTGLQKHFEAVSEGDVELGLKPQQVERLPEIFEGTVADFLPDSSREKDEVVEKLGIDHLMERQLEKLSGGELQRVAIASTVQEDADLYLFDESSSFLDVKQRLISGRLIRELEDGEAVMAIEHDLATLDLIADNVHIFYGEKASYGKVSDSFSNREGINNYLDGYLPTHNVRFRSDSISFKRSKRSQVENNDAVASFNPMEKDFGGGEFSLNTSGGTIHEEEIIGIFGENGLGKTVFAKMLSGVLEADTGKELEIDISYKPQYIESRDETVEEAISGHANPDSKSFQTRIAEPLEIESLYEQNLGDLSGGELQKVAVAICLSKEADIYLLDEPSAYLDVESRARISKTLKKFARKTGDPLMVIDHDLMLLDQVADRGIVFKGEPGVEGESSEPVEIGEAVNSFLEEVDVTFRKDPETGRMRANKPGSRKDREQRREGEYYEQ